MIPHHQGSHEESREHATAKREPRPTELYDDLVGLGLERSNAGIKVGDISSDREGREGFVLEVGDLRPRIKEHPVGDAVNVGRHDRDANELVQVYVQSVVF